MQHPFQGIDPFTGKPIAQRQELVHTETHISLKTRDGQPLKPEPELEHKNDAAQQRKAEIIEQLRAERAQEQTQSNKI